MSWLDVLTSILGVPTGAAALAAAVYAGAIAAEKEAKPRTLVDIGTYIFNKSDLRTIKISAIVKKIFNNTFGPKHFSLKCIIASMVASAMVFIALVLQFSLPTGIWPIFDDYNGTGGYFAIICITLLIDYLALLKSRFIINIIHDGAIRMINVGLIDVATSIIMAWAGTSIIIFLEGIDELSDTFWSLPGLGAELLKRLFTHNSDVFPVAGVIIAMPLLSSVWILLITVSTMFLNIAAPAQRAVAWFFPVEEHPIRAIGTVAAGLIMLSSLVWVLVRPLFA